MLTNELTSKSDVYSIGILLLEIVTGRRPLELKRSVDERVALRWAFKKFNEGSVVELIDPAMEEVVDAEVLGKLFELSFCCVAPSGADRPGMKRVAEQLWNIRKDYLRETIVLAALTALRPASITCSAVSVRCWGLDFDYKLSLIWV
ncbi:hypothetical protein M0R45_001417 [Rubus argutus]|uniref:non-specific serine/threonine protein kinase n=1 Tax=Rubus argutus TaxID=59490 RepID=A0AAW1VIL9_RUBAR